VPNYRTSGLSRILRLVFFLSGWAVAAWLGYHYGVSSLFEGLPTSAAKSETPADKVDRVFREWQANSELAGAAVGFCLLDESGQQLFTSPMASVAMCPASSLKTVTSGAALNLLGLDFRFETVLAASSALTKDGSVEGDLILVGSGDPTLSSDDLVQMANQAVSVGLKNVTGRLIADTSIFPEHPTNDFWNWGDIGNYYGAGAYGVNVDHNTLQISFEPGAEAGAPAKVVEVDPATRDVEWVNHVATGAEHSGDQVVVYSEPYGRKITLRGTVPKGESGFTVRGAIPDPPALAVEVLRSTLEAAGVKFANPPGTSVNDKRIPLSKHQSAPLPEIVDHLHRVSDNLETQCLFLTMGRLQKAAPADVVRDYWQKAGVSFAGLRMLDGNGLARANTIRPLDLAGINSAARRSPQGQRFFESLTIYANGNIRAKRGAMSGVKTEVGFLRTANGRELTYAVMGNALGRKVDFWGLKQELLDAVATAGF
jgi:D-alanyl-D-alanine carboxypeptidase/D-alanyl-D-alanine-endopeptidase (penicillin-binding protein 4)